MKTLFKQGLVPVFLLSKIMKFYLQGRGFISEKHIEAIKSINGQIVNTIEEADWVVILTPNWLHYWQIIDALKKGKNVLCEKPLVISETECQDLINIKGNKKIFSVFQLRYLPILKDIKILDWNDIKIVVNVHRDKKYFESWKGKDEKSGGILYNLGIHYLDLIILLFGEPKEIRKGFCGNKENNGFFKGDNYSCEYTFAYETPEDKQYRKFEINGKEYNLETTENLHKQVYQDLIKEKGITPEDNLKVINLIEKLK